MRGLRIKDRCPVPAKIISSAPSSSATSPPSPPSRGRNEEALTTLERLAGEPVSFVHLGKLRYAPDWETLRANARFQKLAADAEAAIKAQPSK